MSDSAHIPTHYHLVGDIGGTNARFAFVPLALVDRQRWQSTR
jgi:glucokinase